MDFLSSADSFFPGGVRALASSLSAVAGAFVAASVKKISHRGLCVLISFAAGALLAVALFDLLPESIEMSGIFTALICVAVGYGFFFLVSRFVSHVCPACSATHAEAHFQSVTGPLVAALSVHSFIDGLALYGHGSSLTGSVVLIAILFHKFPEGLALSLVARGSGVSRWRAFGLAAFVEVVTTFLGALAGAGVLAWTEDAILGYLMGFVAGSFVFLVFHALLSELFKHHPRSTILSACTGAGVIAAIGFLWGGH